MSYEGYVQILCEKGHLSEVDCYVYNSDTFRCKICGAKEAWSNGVDLTNGSFEDDGSRIDGYIELKIAQQTRCKECGSILETIYKIPKKGKRRSK